MFEIKRYTSDMSAAWNDFVAQSKNGTFLLDRRYMDYHADRFTDCSLMVFRRGKLYGLLPGNVAGGTFYSHQGLTYGGLVMNDKCTAADVVTILPQICRLLKEEGLRKMVYKPVPWIYHRQPAEEDLYAIVEVCGARLLGRSLSSTITREHTNKRYRIRQNGARQARQAGVIVEETADFGPFWHILTDNLGARYGLRPVHTLEEIQLLWQRFPDRIRLFVAKENGVTIAGTVLYVTDRVVHSQYIAANDRGKQRHALDLLFEVVIEQALEQHTYFDFGISTEKHGTYLNEQLIYQKEGFGGRGICYDWYEWTL
ncbi:MAG: GNAT family N-acetyltransferase [Prevotella sp.]|nr:GNAT family N-acetyltransferase [Prevotella sp.]